MVTCISPERSNHFTLDSDWPASLIIKCHLDQLVPSLAFMLLFLGMYMR
jgi:hypothetical protein